MKKLNSEKLDKMSYKELTMFHNWFFGYDKDYMTMHILENSTNLDEELNRFSDQKQCIDFPDFFSQK